MQYLPIFLKYIACLAGLAWVAYCLRLALEDMADAVSEWMPARAPRDTPIVDALRAE